MIESWQVWLADLAPTEGREQSGIRPVVVVSSELHLRSQGGRGVLICPITSRYRNVSNHVAIQNLKGDTNYVMTEQLRFISTSRFERNNSWWTLQDNEIYQVRRVLPFMLDI